MKRYCKTEAVEVCPHCGVENTYPDWNVKQQGFVAVCKHCGHQIFLCDECLHAPDNRSGYCDWHEEKGGGRCFRGTMK